MRSVLLFSLMIVGMLMSEVSGKVVNQKTSLRHNSKHDFIAPEDWPSDGSWIVRINENKHESVTQSAREKAKTRKGTKEFQAKTGLKRLKNFHTVVMEGLSREEILSLPDVVSVQPNYVRRMAITTPTLPTWGQDRIDQKSLPLNDAYSPTYTGCGVDVYIIDTGIDTTHQEFSAVDGVTRTVSNIWNSYGAISDDIDDEGHGTHVAGTVGGNTVGISSCANLYGMKVLDSSGSGYDSDIMSAMEEVATLHETAKNNGGNPKSIINMSLGGTCGSASQCKQDSLVQLVNTLASSGIISAIAAGNDDADAKKFSPASASDAITVGASDSTDTIAWFSNYGSTLDIFAPGVGIISACATHSTDPSCTGQLYVSWDGTSMATPHVAGALAQYLEKMDLSPGSLEDVSNVRQQLMCDAANNKIQGVKSSTTKTLLQVPTASTSCSSSPTLQPTKTPTAKPTISSKPTKTPSQKPTRSPTSRKPTVAPSTRKPTKSPTKAPTKSPTRAPSKPPTRKPTA